MTSILSSQKSRSLMDLPGLALPSVGGGLESAAMDERLRRMRTLISGAVGNLATVASSESQGLKSVPQLLKDRLIALKRMTSTVAMHLDPSWRISLFSTLDRLLDPDDWEPEFAIPSEQSFSTFLRMIIYLHPTKRPGLGLAPTGHFLAAWTSGEDRIVIECVGKDEVKWVLTRTIDGERESAAGRVLLHRVPDVIAAYDPEPLFTDGHQLLA